MVGDQARVQRLGEVEDVGAHLVRHAVHAAGVHEEYLLLREARILLKGLDDRLALPALARARARGEELEEEARERERQRQRADESQGVDEG